MSHIASRYLSRAVLCLSFALASSSVTLADDQGAGGANSALAPIREYIAKGWDTLTRSQTNCATIVDPKLSTASVLYLPADFPTPPGVSELEQKCHIQVQHLPRVIRKPGELDTSSFEPHGLLYLEHPYVVPGGRFNEMYGWDSYFIVVGLVRDGRVDLAKGMVENFFFEIERYGTILNANRTYYLTRSQPPFLTSMILSVYEAEKAAGHQDRAWLAKAYKFAAKDYENWMSEAHHAGDTGLARYYDFGNGPAPESLQDEAGIHRRVAAYFLAHPEAGREYLVTKNPSGKPAQIYGSTYSVDVCDVARTMARPECTSAGEVGLSADYYKGDRAMRESGYDVSFRFGPFGAGTHHFAPVCLNSLLYKMEKDLEHISETLGDKKDAALWSARAAKRRELVQKYMWDGQRGMYFDYDFVNKKRSTYEYVTTFFPLFAGLATKEQASALVNNLRVFERPGGLVMSTLETGAQWDFPYAWAPNQIVTNLGLRRYGFNQESDRISYKFLSTIAENFRRDGDIREKYNAVTRSSETAVSAGYHMNVIGFGWTNAAFVELLHALPADLVDKLAKEQTAPAPAAAAH